MKLKTKYIEVLNKYLRWADYCGYDNTTKVLHPDYALSYNSEALSAEEIIFNWESKGIKLPKECSNPKLLDKYIAGKRDRDLYITSWKQDITEGIMSLFDFELLIDLIWLGDLKVFKDVKVPYKGCYKTYKEWSMSKEWTL